MFLFLSCDTKKEINAATEIPIAVAEWDIDSTQFTYQVFEYSNHLYIKNIDGTLEYKITMNYTLDVIIVFILGMCSGMFIIKMVFFYLKH